MFDKEEIENLRIVFNQRYNEKIPEGPSEKVWETILKKFSKQCKSSRSECIFSHMMNKPKSPTSWITKPTDWLSDKDIDEVEKEFMVLIKEYKFLGCVSIDFDLKSPEGKCIVDALCSTQLKELYKTGKTKIGIVFNTDVHTGSGEHWMALYCDISPEVEPRITFFDSYSEKPSKEIKRLMLRWKDEWDSTKIHNKKMETTYNSTRHQYKNSECGMYCLYFHYCCLNNIPMDESIPDIVMNSFRNVLFRR
jgi:hypothetical protein